jgi:hypothetical protein
MIETYFFRRVIGELLGHIINGNTGKKLEN